MTRKLQLAQDQLQQSQIAHREIKYRFYFDGKVFIL